MITTAVLSSFATDLVNWFGRLPPHIQTPLIQATATVVTAGITLRGVSMTLRWNERKHREDRELALKKDIFANWLKEFQAIVSRLDRLETDHEVIVTILGEDDISHALRLVATRDTLKVVREAWLSAFELQSWIHKRAEEEAAPKTNDEIQALNLRITRSRNELDAAFVEVVSAFQRELNIRSK